MDISPRQQRGVITLESKSAPGEASRPPTPPTIEVDQTGEDRDDWLKQWFSLFIQ